MSPWVSKLLRALLILNSLLLGLAGLALSACGGMMTFAGPQGAAWLIFFGLAFLAVNVLFIIWIIRTSDRAVLIAFLVLLVLPAVLGLFRGLRH